MAEYICPNCGKPVYDDEALLCHFCGESLARAGQGLLGRIKYAPWQKVPVALVLVIIVVILFVLMIVR